VSARVSVYLPGNLKERMDDQDSPKPGHRVLSDLGGTIACVDCKALGSSLPKTCQAWADPELFEKKPWIFGMLLEEAVEFIEKHGVPTEMDLQPGITSRLSLQRNEAWDMIKEAVQKVIDDDF
jgi:hypothetical protein